MRSNDVIYGPGDDNYGRDLKPWKKTAKKCTYIDDDGIEKELCVLCKAKTQVPSDKDINLRDFYVEGSGQLCYKCGRAQNESI